MIAMPLHRSDDRRVNCCLVQISEFYVNCFRHLLVKLAMASIGGY